MQSNHGLQRIPDARYLGGEHVTDSVPGTLEQQGPDQEADQHHVGEERAEVHHLQPITASVSHSSSTPNPLEGWLQGEVSEGEDTRYPSFYRCYQFIKWSMKYNIREQVYTGAGHIIRIS